MAQAIAVILRACGLSAELFDKVKRPELDGQYTAAPLCGARQNARPFVNFTGLAQSEEQPTCKRQAAGSIPCTEHHFARFAHSAEHRLG